VSQPNTPTQRAQEPFDAIPCSVQDRTDLIGNAKRLYAALCSAHRMGWQPTYQQLADRLGASERSIVRWVQRLTDAGLIAVRRRGQGLANILTVLALVTSGTDKVRPPAAPGWRGPTRSPSFKNEERRTGREWPYRDPAAYLETRTGTLRSR
jgi:DNA-binding transcriptional ArsR family regulator